MLARVRLGVALVAAAFGLGVACYTPSVPLPPPNVSALTFQAAPTMGYAILQGTPEPRHANARFYIFDRASGDGVITTAAGDGTFTTDPFKIKSPLLDTVQIYYENTAGESSQVICSPLGLNQHPAANACN